MEKKNFSRKREGAGEGRGDSRDWEVKERQTGGSGQWEPAHILEPEKDVG